MYQKKYEMPIMPNIEYLFRGEELEEDRIDKINANPSVSHMPNMEEQMSDKMNMSNMDMQKIKSDTEEIVEMFEKHHPDLINTLTNCNMSLDQARQYLSRIVEMTIMHHMMH